MYLNSVTCVKTINDAGPVLYGLELDKIGDGAAIDVFVCFNNKFPCFEGGAALNRFKFGHKFTGKIESHKINCFGEVIIYLKQ
jgi:hypothetical protein